MESASERALRPILDCHVAFGSSRIDEVAEAYAEE